MRKDLEELENDGEDSDGDHTEAMRKSAMKALLSCHLDVLQSSLCSCDDIEQFEDSDESVDEEFEEGLPICVQGSLTKLRKDRTKLSSVSRSLKRQLKESRMWSAELERRVEELRQKVARLEGQLAPAGPATSCEECRRLQLQLDEVGERLGSGQLSFVHQETVATQTEEGGAAGAGAGWGAEGVAAQVREAAASVMEQQGMVYEETSGLWYDFKSGYYFDPATGLYYDGHQGVWYQYHPDTGQYVVNSRVPEAEVIAQKILSQEARDAMEARAKKEEERKKRRKSKDKGKGPDLAEALDSLNSVVADHEYSDDSEAEAETIPCLRIVVTASEDPEVTVGCLYLVTCKGGSVGSRGEHEVALQDKGCSKHHARISFSRGKYFLKDLGSRNGTWVGGKRVSVSKQESEEVEVGHGTTVQIGKTKLLCHLHPGRETCLECEPGLVRVEARAGAGAATREEARKESLHTMKRKYGLDNPAEDLLRMEDRNSKDFTDRAKERRRLIGSSHGSEKTETASVDTAIGADNKGFKMLAKMGYKGGAQGLGKHNQGRAEPVRVEQRAERAGLGSSAASVSVDSRKNAIWIKTQKRFKTTSLLQAFNQNDTDEDDGAVNNGGSQKHSS